MAVEKDVGESKKLECDECERWRDSLMVRIKRGKQASLGIQKGEWKGNR